MDDQTLAARRAALDVERGRLLDELREEVDAPGPMTYGSQAAAATHVFEQQRDLALRERSERALAEIDAALARMAAGRTALHDATRWSQRATEGFLAAHHRRATLAASVSEA
jgi:RNA polymerase-binding transcription factor DksA